MNGYSDLGVLPEDERIRSIAEWAISGHIVGIALEDDEAKVRCYLARLEESFPKVRHISTDPGPDGIVMVRVGPKARH